MSVSRPAVKNMKKTPAMNSACDRDDIDFQNAARADHGFAPSMATSIVRGSAGFAQAPRPSARIDPMSRIGAGLRLTHNRRGTRLAAHRRSQ
jgi:hypothetical protein